MNLEYRSALPEAGLPVDVAGAASELVGGLLRRPWGQTSVSVYETGRLVSLAPWLTGHDRRLAYLRASERPGGGWGPSYSGYALVPTLSATEALLSALRGGADPRALAPATDRGLRWLLRRQDAGPPLPDMPAIELIVPSLTTLINAHLDALHTAPIPGLQAGRDLRRLTPPAGGGPLSMIRAGLRSGAEVPDKLRHALEVVGAEATGLRGTGAIGASPAATAAGISGALPAGGDPGRRYLEDVARRYGGPVPCASPLTVFERAWVLATLSRARVPVELPAELIRSLTESLGESGAAAGDGLPADADTTGGTLYALAKLGVPYPPGALERYDTGTYFCTWRGENGRSVSTNAHVLDAFGQYRRSRPEEGERYRPVIGRLTSWLCGQQAVDGSWHDRWHASPYYATACAVLALHDFAPADSGGAAAVARAREWVLATQRDEGSWGIWEGTAEETAYALQILLLTGTVPESGVAERGYDYLSSLGDMPNYPPMWHDKDLYVPIAIVQASVLAALHLAQTRPEVSAM